VRIVIWDVVDLWRRFDCRLSRRQVLTGIVAGPLFGWWLWTTSCAMRWRPCRPRLSGYAVPSVPRMTCDRRPLPSRTSAPPCTAKAAAGAWDKERGGHVLTTPTPSTGTKPAARSGPAGSGRPGFVEGDNTPNETSSQRPARDEARRRKETRAVSGRRRAITQAGGGPPSTRRRPPGRRAARPPDVRRVPGMTTEDGRPIFASMSARTGPGSTGPRSVSLDLWASRRPAEPCPRTLTVLPPDPSVYGPTSPISAASRTTLCATRRCRR
jgi:hypothetical protein